WETRVAQGAAGWVHGRRIFLLRDKSGQWRFVGEGPGDSSGQPGPNRKVKVTQDYRVRWSGQQAEPVLIRVTSDEASGTTDGEESPDYPPLEVFRDGALMG